MPGTSGGELVREAYRLIEQGDARQLRTLLANDVFWQPAAHTPRHTAEGGDEVAQRLAWRGNVHRLRVADVLPLGERVVVTLSGRRMHHLGARWWDWRIYQVVTVRDGRIVRIEDYARHKEALAAAGVQHR